MYFEFLSQWQIFNSFQKGDDTFKSRACMFRACIYLYMCTLVSKCHSQYVDVGALNGPSTQFARSKTNILMARLENFYMNVTAPGFRRIVSKWNACTDLSFWWPSNPEFYLSKTWQILNSFIVRLQFCVFVMTVTVDEVDITNPTVWINYKYNIMAPVWKAWLCSSLMTWIHTLTLHNMVVRGIALFVLSIGLPDCSNSSS